MDERQKNLAAITVLVGFVLLVIIIVGIVISSRQIVSPVPDRSVIRVIFISPTPEVIPVSPQPTPESEKDS